VDDDIYAALMRFHREIIVPEIREPLHEQIRSTEKLRNEMLTLADGIYKRFDRVESEITSLKSAVVRLEEQLASVAQRVTSIEEKVDQLALRSELVELEERVDEMQQRIAELKSMLNQH
jgi:chromosome segregation ATPase